jgi:hypothetical protein
VRGDADGLLEESAAALLFHARECFVLEKAGAAQSVDEVLIQPADIEIVGDPHQRRAKV